MAKNNRMEDRFASLRKIEDEAREEVANEAVKGTIHPVVGNPFEDIIVDNSPNNNEIITKAKENTENSPISNNKNSKKNNRGEVTVRVNELFSRKGKCVACSFTLDEEIVDQIELTADEFGMSKSKVVNEILKSVLIK